jgi:alpha-mannosidase
MKNYVMMRPDAREKTLPANVFWWEAPNGSRVLTYRIPINPYGYNTGFDREAFLRKIETFESLSSEQDCPMMLFYGVGNHGGGPTVWSLKILEEHMVSGNTDDMIFSDPDRYFSQLRLSGKTFPVVRGDLQHHASGCYSAHSEIKANNRKAEYRLITAEKFLTAAHKLTGFHYNTTEVRRAWLSVLFNHFHDILGGCSIREAYEDAKEFHGEALKIAGDMLNAALQKIAWAIDTSAGLPSHPGKTDGWILWEHNDWGAPMVVFNPLSWPVTAAIQISGRLCLVTDEEGVPQQLQTVRAQQSNMNEKWDTLFSAILPPLGYRVFKAQTHGSIHTITTHGVLEAGENSLENEYLQLLVDPGTGYISLYDKRVNLSVINGWGAIPVVIDDSESDTWAHGIFSFRKEVGRFGRASLCLLESGPVRITLRVTSHYGKSTLQQDFSLYRAGTVVEVAVKLNWQEEHRMLKLAFPVNVNEPVPIYEIPFGVLERCADGREYPGQTWVDMTGTLPGGTQYGLALANTTKYSYDAKDAELRITMARSTIYADHFSDQDDWCEYMDIGIQYMKYLLLPHEGSWQQSGIIRRAEELLNSPITIPGTYHSGILPLKGQYIDISVENINVIALKVSEESDGVILRCRETWGNITVATIGLHWLGTCWKTAFAPFEIKTFLIKQGTVTETDFLEHPLK